MIRTSPPTLPVLPDLPVLPEPGPPGASSEWLRSVLHSRGMRVTLTRVAVLAALGDEAGDLHRTVQELFANLTDTGVEIDLVTVYRTVTTLTEIGLIYQLAIADRPAKYCLMSTPHQHAICTGCSTVTPIPSNHLYRALAEAEPASPVGLSDRGGLTLHGLCPQCAGDTTSARWG